MLREWIRCRPSMDGSGAEQAAGLSGLVQSERSRMAAETLCLFTLYVFCSAYGATISRLSSTFISADQATHHLLSSAPGPLRSPRPHVASQTIWAASPSS